MCFINEQSYFHIFQWLQIYKRFSLGIILQRIANFFPTGGGGSLSPLHGATFDILWTARYATRKQ